MTLSYILHELHRLLTDKMKEKKVRLKLGVIIAAVVLVLIGLYAAKGNILLNQSDNMENQASGFTDNTKQNISASINIIGGTSNDNVGSTDNVQKESNQNEAKIQSTSLQSAKNIAGILGIAMLTSTGMYLYYRTKQKKCIAPLPVLYSEEEIQ